MLDIFGNEGVTSLSSHYIVPPFSVLDTTSNDWIKRRRLWKKILGNLTLTKEFTLSKTDGEFGVTTKSVMAKMESSSNFDPVLAEIMLYWFCPVSGKILDPFGGEQTKGVVAGVKGYSYSAVEIRKEQIEVNERYSKTYKNINYYCGDALDISNIITERNFDLVFTSPPYYNLETYSKGDGDMSNLQSYHDFIRNYKKIFSQCYDMLADNRFLVLKIGEIRDNKGAYYNFVGDNIRILMKIGFIYYNEIILLNSIGTLPFRAGRFMQKNRKVGKRHQNILVFYKGDITKIKENFDEL